ncbi:MAG UNVERIFIED_CONTAM: hypothetical protein LVQ98_00415 [Rickettsiaceae bacterium]
MGILNGGTLFPGENGATHTALEFAMKYDELHPECNGIWGNLADDIRLKTDTPIEPAGATLEPGAAADAGLYS